MRPRLDVLAALCLGLVLSVPSTAARSAAEPNDPGSPDARRSVVTVLGHWTIEVFEPDGRLKSRYEFDNALEETGPLTLVSILARQFSVGLWGIILNGSGCDVTCNIVESRSTLAADHTFRTLTVAASANTITLTGTASAVTDGTILVVRTENFRCSPGTAPASPCTSPSATFITRRDLDPPLAVSMGQQIQVTVRLSFVSAGS